MISWYNAIYNALRDAFGWVKDKQEAAIVYYLLEYDGDIKRTASKLGAPQARVVHCRKALEEEGYLKVMAQSFSHPEGVCRKTIHGNMLLRALKADREANGEQNAE